MKFTRNQIILIAVVAVLLVGCAAASYAAHEGYNVPIFKNIFGPSEPAKDSGGFSADLDPIDDDITVSEPGETESVGSTTSISRSGGGGKPYYNYYYDTKTSGGAGADAPSKVNGYARSGSTVPKPDAPSIPGKAVDFQGWYAFDSTLSQDQLQSLDLSTMTPWDFDKDTLSRSTYLYAIFTVDVTYDIATSGGVNADAGAMVLSEQLILFNGNALPSQPVGADPVITGKNVAFKGWHTAADGATAWAFGTDAV
ncbi:InlB B-repeat-containing protein, partial [Methanimicrococcus sp. OttesenSCG-928-J09]|nr:InlB B-repeat-containing protein [Methanimicrococcus sp. OttesenSCG-928-J09]